MKIAHVKICNYRNLKDIDIGLSDTVAVIGENNSGKSNFLKAITLPFLTDDNTHTSKRLSWTDINNESKERYYKKIIEIQKEIKDDKITVEQFIKLLPIVSVEVNIQANGPEEYYVKDMSYAIADDKIQYGLKYEFIPKNCEDIFRVVKEVVSQNEINEENLRKVKMNLLPVEYYNYSIKIPDGRNISYDTLKTVKYEALEAERDDFSRTKNQLGSKALVDLLKEGVGEGVIRADINMEIVATLLTFQFELLKKSDQIFNSKYTFTEIFETIFKSFIRGIATPEGVKYTDEFFEENR